jgi:hypothetical protein
VPRGGFLDSHYLLEVLRGAGVLTDFARIFLVTAR